MNDKAQMEKYSDEIGLYDLLIVLKRRIRYVITVFVIGIVIGGLVAFLSPDIYQARATLWVDSLVAQSMIERFKASDNKFSFIIPLGQTKTPESNNLSLSILGSSEFKKNVFDKLREKYGERENIKEIFKAEIDKKTGSIKLISEQTDRKFAEDILKIVIEEFERSLIKYLRFTLRHYLQKGKRLIKTKILSWLL